MVAYHDDEWGVPCHDDIELFERLALESFQAGLSWSTILRKREAFRAAFRGFDPRVVAAFDDADRARLMADAGIVRNRAKIDATIGNAGAVPGHGRRVRVVRCLSRHDGAVAAGSPARLGVGGRHPGHDAGLGRAVGGPEAARLPVRRLDDRLRVHAERRPGRRPPAGLLPLRRDTLAVTTAPRLRVNQPEAEGVQQMITIDCPLCAGPATIDQALTLVTCDGCGIAAEIAPDPFVALEAVA